MNLLCCTNFIIKADSLMTWSTPPKTLCIYTGLKKKKKEICSQFTELIEVAAFASDQSINKY